MSTSSGPKKWLWFQNQNLNRKHFSEDLLNLLQISTSVMRETSAVQMLYVTIFMDHTIAHVKKAIMEMAKPAEVKLPQFSSFPLLLFAGSAL